MGVVYEAFDRESQRVVAVKTLRHFDAAALYLFKQEFRTIADVHHTNLVHLYELVADEAGKVFFTMELVRGSDFRTYVQRPDARIPSTPPSLAGSSTPTPRRRERERNRDTVLLKGHAGASPVISIRPLSPADPNRLRASLRQLVEGLHALHSAGKLHRDIKPSNVLVTRDGRVVLLDFGVAADFSGRDAQGSAGSSGSGEMVGTASYMAPEQGDDEALTPASDWYSVGVMLYEALVGNPPFAGSMVQVLTMKSMHDPPPPSECVEGAPPDLDALCRALLHRDPRMRPASTEILQRLGVTHSSAPPSMHTGAVDPSAAFIGREQQLEVLREAFAAAVSGRSITVRVGGASGMGKSTVVQYFLDELAGDRKAIILRGRAYERESVPYKAVDTVIDALSRHLLVLAESDEPLAFPEDMWALARLFPVLQRVPGFDAPAEPTLDDPQALRRRAFGALREVTASLAARQPTVLFVDDAQWGDVDSAVLLLELLRPPAAPPLLLLMTYRDSEAQASPFLTEMRDRWPERAEVRDVTVGPLEAEDAYRLALTLLDASDGASQETARAMAHESRGNPFLIGELVRSSRPSAGSLGVLTLDQMVSERLARLPDEARRLIEIVAVGGRPMPVSIVADSSGVGDGVNETIALLGARRFVNTGLRYGREVVETSHDRIRETIVALLPAAVLREHHTRLARALEQAPGADAEAVAVHLWGAGEGARAAVYAERAAEQAVTKLAFNQAVNLFGGILQATPPTSPEIRRLRVRLAEVLAWAGRSAEAGRAYLLAAEGAPTDQRPELERAAAEQLIGSGRIDEGAAVLRRVLATAGMTAPRTAPSAVFWLVVYQVWLRVVGLRFKERNADEVSREDRLRIDALYIVALLLAIVDVIVGTSVAARHLIAALRAGDRFQVARAAILEAVQGAKTGGPEGARERALTDIARRLSGREVNAESRAFILATHGVGLFLRGRWKPALDMLDGAMANVPNNRAGWQSNANLFGAYCLVFLGEYRELKRRRTRLLADAEQRGDLYVSVQLRASHPLVLCLVADDPETARRDAHEAMAQWSQAKFLVQHWQAMLCEADIELYVGDGARAQARVERDASALKWSLLGECQFIRGLTEFARGRAAVASLDAVPSLRRARLAEARHMAKRLDRERMEWTTPLARIVSAGIANATGDRRAAIAALRAAAETADGQGMTMHAAAARYQLGSFLGDREGGELVQRAEAAMRLEEVRAPACLAAMFVPGRWAAGA
jgi:hypothetical protein